MAEVEDTGTEETATWVADAVRALDAVCRAARHYGLYPPGHPGSAGAVSGAHEAIAALTEGREAIILAAVGERLLVDGTEAVTDAMAARLAGELRSRNIRAMRLSAGVDESTTEALLQILSMDLQQLQKQGGPAGFVHERDLTRVEIEEVSYERFVTESDAARDAPPEDVFLRALNADSDTLASMDVTSLVGMLDTPQRLANKLVSWLTASGGSGGYGGEGGGGSGVGPGVGDGIGTGGEIPLVLSGHEVDAGNRAGAMLALALQRLGEAVHERAPNEWASMQRKMTDVFRSLSVGLRRRVMQADVVSEDARIDVLESLGETLNLDEALELLGTDAEEVIGDPSVTIERLLRRLAPTQDRLESIAPAAREHLKDLGLPDEASSSVVGRLLDSLGKSNGPGAGDRQLGSFRTDEATRERRRTEGEDLFASLEDHAAWRARTSVCLEVLESVREPDDYLKVLDAVESGLARLGEDNGISVRVVNALRRQQQSEDLPRRCRQRTAQALASLESAGGIESIRAALDQATGAERGPLIALLADLGPGGMTVLNEMLRDPSRVSDLPMILATLARIERERADAAQADEADVDPDAETPEIDAESSAPEKQLDFRSLLLDPRWKNAPAAVEHLAVQSGTFATKYLSIALTRGYFALRAAVIQALSSRPSADGMELLITALDNSEPGIKEMAAISLGQIRDPRVAVALMQVANARGMLDKRTRLRAVAMISLGALRCTAATDLLVQALRHKALFRREAAEELSVAAATALGRLGTARARAALEQGTNDRRAAVQQACYRALSEVAATDG